MAKLGSKKRPVVVRVQDEYRAKEIAEICSEHGLHFLIGLEPGEPEDISDVDKLLNPVEPLINHFNVGRNEACPCGSGKKYKKCCLM